MSKQKNKTLGNLGENLAADYLIKQGYKIIKRNFRTRYGEIDIIAQDKDTLAFIEVKTRKSSSFGSPEESLTSRKIKHLIKAVNYYQITHLPNLPRIRIELISICLAGENLLKKLNHYKNISI